jgi:dUTP pyrophosphatase
MLKILKMHDDVKDVVWDEGNADFDLFPYIDEPIVIPALTVAVIPTGVKFMIPEGYNIKLESRSGYASRGIIVIGGVIDETYRGEIKVIIFNTTSASVLIEQEKAICQANIRKTFNMDISYIHEDEFNTNTTRGEDGFGSSDKQ